MNESQKTGDRISEAASHFIFCLLCAVFCILIHHSSLFYSADSINLARLSVSRRAHWRMSSPGCGESLRGG